METALSEIVVQPKTKVYPLSGLFPVIKNGYNVTRANTCYQQFKFKLPADYIVALTQLFSQEESVFVKINPLEVVLSEVLKVVRLDSSLSFPFYFIGYYINPELPIRTFEDADFTAEIQISFPFSIKIVKCVNTNNKSNEFKQAYQETKNRLVAKLVDNNVIPSVMKDSVVLYEASPVDKGFYLVWQENGSNIWGYPAKYFTILLHNDKIANFKDKMDVVVCTEPDRWNKSVRINEKHVEFSDYILSCFPLHNKDRAYLIVELVDENIWTGSEGQQVHHYDYPLPSNHRIELYDLNTILELSNGQLPVSLQNIKLPVLQNVKDKFGDRLFANRRYEIKGVFYNVIFIYDRENEKYLCFSINEDFVERFFPAAQTQQIALPLAEQLGNEDDNSINNNQVDHIEQGDTKDIVQLKQNNAVGEGSNNNVTIEEKATQPTPLIVHEDKNKELPLKIKTLNECSVDRIKIKDKVVEQPHTKKIRNSNKHTAQYYLGSLALITVLVAAIYNKNLLYEKIRRSVAYF